MTAGRALHAALRPLALAVALLALGACARDDARPEGIAERWLHAVSDSGREGLQADAEERMHDHGDPALAARIVPADASEDERVFSDLEVGKAIVAGDTARVPFRATARIVDDERRELTGTAVLTKTEGEWRVADLQSRADGERVPSEGGTRPARANLSQWVLALVAGLALTIVSIVLIEAQPRARPAPQG